MIVIKTIAGLCNRLRAMFSYLLFARKNNKKLKVAWSVGADCNGRFQDYFYVPNDVILASRHFGNIDYNGCFHTHSDFGGVYLYNDLKLLPHMEEKINEKRQQLGKYISVHIRRTDHINLAKEQKTYTEEQAYIEFINGYPEYNVYIATDNLETQQFFYNLYKDRIKVIKHIESSTKLRQTSLEEAIIDLYLCIYSDKFMGTPYSSYTDTILSIRQNTNKKEIDSNEISPISDLILDVVEKTVTEPDIE